MRLALVTCLIVLLHANLGLGAGDTNYQFLVVSGNAALKLGKLDEALKLANDAVALNTNRFEAYALQSMILGERGDTNSALRAITHSIALAPESNRPKLENISAVFGGAPPAKVNTLNPSTELDATAKRKLEVLKLILTDADAAKTGESRRKLLEEYLGKSDDLVKENSNIVPVWLIRAAIGLELNRPQLAWEAGRRLSALNAANDANAVKVLAQLDRKGWLGEKPPVNWPSADADFENSLGQKFKPIPGSEALMCIWETRVQDFEAFIKDTGYASTLDKGRTWERPGFAQGRNHPVCIVSWYDAMSFCSWLTKKDRKMGLLSSNARYRLPTEEEFKNAVGSHSYPWGDKPSDFIGYANFAGQETIDAGSKTNGVVIPNYRDDFAWTAPVGSFKPNQNGFFDLAGNVCEWGLEQIKLKPEGNHEITVAKIYGFGDWGTGDSLHERIYAEPTNCSADFGFRVIIAYKDYGYDVAGYEAELKNWQIRNAAELGDAEAQADLGSQYEFGYGFGPGQELPKINNSEALEWFRRSAKQGNKRGELFLAGMYYYGKGVSTNYAEAFSWYRKSADQGVADAQNMLGKMYENGQGIHQDKVEALKWYKLAARDKVLTVNDPSVEEAVKRLDQSLH